jgi:hypothetical protein
MSNALAIASVTAVLKDLLNNGVIDHDLTSVVGSDVAVTALPPDRIEVEARLIRDGGMTGCPRAIREVNAQRIRPWPSICTICSRLMV